jgi:hypothetical protein
LPFWHDPTAPQIPPAGAMPGDPRIPPAGPVPQPPHPLEPFLPKNRSDSAPPVPR